VAVGEHARKLWSPTGLLLSLHGGKKEKGNFIVNYIGVSQIKWEARMKKTFRTSHYLLPVVVPHYCQLLFRAAQDLVLNNKVGN
jgi:hypothetical protein